MEWEVSLKIRCVTYARFLERLRNPLRLTSPVFDSDNEGNSREEENVEEDDGEEEDGNDPDSGTYQEGDICYCERETSMCGRLSMVLWGE